MLLLANENFPEAAVTALRTLGHDVAWVRTDAPGSTDTFVLEWAQRQNRILLTFDKDFGELVFRSRFPAMAGVVLFRISLPSAAHAARAAVAVVDSQAVLAGHFTVVEDGRIRTAPLPVR